MTANYHDYLGDDNYKSVVTKALTLLKQPIQLIRAQVQDLCYRVDVITAEIDQALYELASIHVYVEDGRMEAEGDMWDMEDGKSVAKFSYTLEGDDDWRACKSELNSVKEMRDTLSSLKWDLREKRSSILNLMNKEL